MDVVLIYKQSFSVSVRFLRVASLACLISACGSGSSGGGQDDGVVTENDTVETPETANTIIEIDTDNESVDSNMEFNEEFDTLENSVVNIDIQDNDLESPTETLEVNENESNIEESVVVNAGADQSGIILGNMVHLDGSQSQSSSELSYSWSVLASPVGAESIFSHPERVVSTFKVNQPGEYQVQLRGVVGDVEQTDVITISVIDGDLDQDGLASSVELRVGLDPSNPDSDGDGLIDGGEDQDGDCFSNTAEAGANTSLNDPSDYPALNHWSPCLALTDQDGLPIRVDDHADRIRFTPTGSALVFSTFASLLEEDLNLGGKDVYHYDTVTKQLTLVSLTSDGGQPTTRFNAEYPVISPNEKNILFVSNSAYLISEDKNSRASDLFIKNLETGQLDLVSVTAQGLQRTEGTIRGAFINDDEIVMLSHASDFHGGTAPPGENFYKKSLRTGQVDLITFNGVTARTAALGVNSLSLDKGGELLLFSSNSWRIVDNDTNDSSDIFSYEFSSNETTRLSLDANNNEVASLGSHTSFRPRLSRDGQRLAFISVSDKWVDGDTNSKADVFVKNLISGHVDRVSVYPDRTEPRIGKVGQLDMAFSPDGSKLAFYYEGALIEGAPTSGYVLYTVDLESFEFDIVFRTISGEPFSVRLPSRIDWLDNGIHTVLDHALIRFISPNPSI